MPPTFERREHRNQTPGGKAALLRTPQPSGHRGVVRVTADAVASTGEEHGEAHRYPADRVVQGCPAEGRTRLSDGRGAASIAAARNAVKAGQRQAEHELVDIFGMDTKRLGDLVLADEISAGEHCRSSS